MGNRGVIDRHHRGARLIPENRLIKKLGVITLTMIHQALIQLNKIISNAQGFGGVHMG